MRDIHKSIHVYTCAVWLNEARQTNTVVVSKIASHSITSTVFHTSIIFIKVTTHIGGQCSTE